ncbi:Zn-ribbon domain-containing OB-fold protein [Nocardia thailandica]|uniref:Zn-ribbon domain-containing OB-fold protein n=1 Tax=Nocardia thailandica TaxID=257275 RepID=A0ABW6PUY6_9NOCA
MTQGNTAVEVLSAPLRVRFDYTRSVGPIIGAFLAGLREGRILGARGSDERVLVPPPEFDPQTAAPIGELVEVAAVGTVRSWTWVPQPLPGQPFDRPFAWAFVQLDGADTTLLHAVDVTSPQDIHTGLRVRVRWAAERTGRIQDIACFEPGDTAVPATPQDATEPVEILTTPVDLSYKHTASPQETVYLRGLAEGKLLGGRSRPGDRVYFPPRGANPTDGTPTDEVVELSDHGTVTTFCIVNVPFLGQRIKPPYVAAYILLDGADIPVLHLVLGCDASEVRMGMRVEAVWKPREEWGHGLENVDHFRPSGEPDAEYDTYRQHL